MKLDSELKGISGASESLLIKTLENELKCSENDEEIRKFSEDLESDKNTLGKQLELEKFELQIQIEDLKSKFSESCKRLENAKADGIDLESKTRENLSKLESLILEKNKIIQMKQDDPQKKGVVKISSRTSVRGGSEYCKVCGFPKNGKMKICKFCKNPVHLKCIEGLACKICTQKEAVSRY